MSNKLFSLLINLAIVVKNRANDVKEAQRLKIAHAPSTGIMGGKFNDGNFL
jgi:hypothetical protein